MQIYIETYGEEHPDLALSYNNFGFALSDLGEVERTHGEVHPLIATSCNNLGLAFF